jgi:hypothetical protein
MLYIFGGWLALNAAVVVAVLTRRPRYHLRQRLFRWVIGDSAPARRRQFAHSLVVAHRRNH